VPLLLLLLKLLLLLMMMMMLFRRPNTRLWGLLQTKQVERRSFVWLFFVLSNKTARTGSTELLPEGHTAQYT
jgi:hypothetical protein